MRGEPFDDGDDGRAVVLLGSTGEILEEVVIPEEEYQSWVRVAAAYGMTVDAFFDALITHMCEAFKAGKVGTIDELLNGFADARSGPHHE